NLCGLSKNAAVPVKPQVVAKSYRVDHQGVAGPRGRRVPLPRRHWVLGQRTAVSEYLPVNAIKLVEHHKKARRVDKLQIVREPIRTQKQIGKAPDVWIVFCQRRNAVLNQRSE